MTNPSKNTEYIGYEYTEVSIKSSMKSVYMDGYENFGWQIESIDACSGMHDQDVLKMKRDRLIPNKIELRRLQQQFEACITEIQRLEFSRYIKSSAVAYTIGVLGTAFMSGSVFTVLAGRTLLSVVLAIPAFVGWVIPYLLYKNLFSLKEKEVRPFIEQKYDEIHAVCQKANKLLVC